MESEELPSSKEDMRTNKNSSTTNINEEQNMQRRGRKHLQNYPASCTYSDLKKWQIFNLLHKKFASQIHMIIAFDNGSALIMSKDRMVYGLGINTFGRLGLYGKNYIQPEKVKTLCGKNIKAFYCNTYATCIFAVTEEGEIYSWGGDEKSRVKREFDSYKDMYKPDKIDFLSEECITDIASNRYNSLALTGSGKIYIWGDVEFSNERFESKPCRVKFKLEKEKIINIACVKIVCGDYHSLALTSEGKIYSWGSNCNGQLGHGKKTKLEQEPVMLDVPVMGSISDIGAQKNKSFAINKNGCIYVWGIYDMYDQKNWEPVRTEYSNISDIFRYNISYIVHDREKSNILEHLAAAFNDLSTSDLTIEVEGEFIYVHKAILKIRCQYFRRMFQNDWVENNQNIIKHNYFSYNVYNAFLKYLYTDQIVDDLSLEETFELLKLCNKYNETNFERRCIQTIRENITVSNVALYYAKAIECDIKDLEEFCFEFALCHMTDVILSETFAKLNKDLKIDFIIKTAKTGVYKT